jgi:hypothetical protein
MLVVVLILVLILSATLVVSCAPMRPPYASREREDESERRDDK